MESTTLQNREREAQIDPSRVGIKILGVNESSEPNFMKPEFRDLFEKDSKSWNTTLSEAKSMKPEEITEMITKKDFDIDTNLNRLRTWEYVLLYRYIQTSNDESGWNSLPERDKHSLAKVQNETMNTLHKNVNNSLKNYLLSQNSDHASNTLKVMEENEKHEESNLGNIKVFRGLFL